MAFNGLRGRSGTGVGGLHSAEPAPAGPTVYVDPESELAGKLRSKGTVRIDGRVKGEIRSDQSVIVAGSARVHASIEADSVLIDGEVKGDIAAKRKITLGKTARVTGDLSTPGIVIEEGAKLKGRIVIGSEEEDPVEATKATTAEKPRPARRVATSVQPAVASQTSAS